MRRVDAVPPTAEVVELETGGDRPDELLVDPPVGEDHSATGAPDAELHVARAGIDVSGPEPTAVIHLSNTGSESSHVVAVDSGGTQGVAVLVPPLVVDVAPAPTHRWPGAVSNGALTRHMENRTRCRARCDAIHAHMLAAK